MTYVVANRPGEDPSLVEVENLLEAQKLVKNIVEQMKVVLNEQHLTITTKENTTAVKWDGNLMVSLVIYEDDEVEVLPTNTGVNDE